MFDILIKNGTVVDGTGNARFVADIAVKDGVIAAIEPKIEAEAAEVIDAAGKVVTPGFIDHHSHSDSTFIFGTDAYNYLEQGITTEVTGHCGSGAVPYYKGLLDVDSIDLPKEKVEEILTACGSFTSFVEYVKNMELGNNLAFYAPQGNIRGRVMGFSSDEPTEEQMQEMEKLMAEAMEAGFVGFTTGLVYAPSVYAGTEELVRLGKVCARYGGRYASHIRGEGSTLVQSVEEAIEIGRRSGIPVTISHLKVLGLKNEGLSAQALDVIEKAREEGLCVHADQYPFLGSAAPLSAQIPPKYLTDGIDALVEKIKLPEVREQIRHSIFEEWQEFESQVYQAGPAGCMVAEAVKTPEIVGKSLADLAAEWGGDGVDALCEVLIRNNGFASGIYFSQNERDMLNIIARPYVVGGTDNSDYNTHEDTERVGGGHPRGMGTFPRRLEILRDKNLLPMEAIIRSMTGLTAEIAGLNERIGTLEVGKQADICILDYENVRCNADFIHPFRKNEGIETVLVRGAVAVRNGTVTGVKNGAFIGRA